jgi:integrase/recombinase XerD
MAEVMYSTGLRRAELVGLDVEDIDHARRAVTVCRGKGRKTRVVPIGRRALEWLDRYVHTRRRTLLRNVWEPALFLSRSGSRMTVKTLTSRMRGHLTAAGVVKGGSCHVFRHSAATLMHDAGADIRDLQALLGHALLTSTQIYTRVSVARLLEVHSRTHPAERGYPRD